VRRLDELQLAEVPVRCVTTYRVGDRLTVLRDIPRQRSRVSRTRSFDDLIALEALVLPVGPAFQAQRFVLLSARCNAVIRAYVIECVVVHIANAGYIRYRTDGASVERQIRLAGTR